MAGARVGPYSARVLLQRRLGPRPNATSYGRLRAAVVAYQATCGAASATEASGTMSIPHRGSLPRSDGPDFGRGCLASWSGCDALRQRVQQIDHALVLASGDDVSRCSVAVARVGRSQPRPDGVITDDRAGEIDNRLQLLRLLLGLRARSCWLRPPASDAAGVRATHVSRRRVAGPAGATRRGAGPRPSVRRRLR